MYYIFQPFYRPMIWGSEQWIISAYPNMESTVLNSSSKGMTLTQLLHHEGSSLMGETLYKRYGTAFPLLIKFIDAKSPLSIQVHPTDDLAHKQGRGPIGKTEMWYALPCSDDAYLLSGLQTSLTPDTYREHVANHTIVNDIKRYTLHEGDCFFLPAGRVHAIGSGCHLLEIQQSSDITYRIYDYDRRDANGNPRELHTELAAESIDYTVLPDYQTHYHHLPNTPVPLVSCPYFETTLYEVTEAIDIDWTMEDRFLILIITSGQGTLSIDGDILTVHTGDALLLSATTQAIHASGQLTFVTVTCPNK